MKHTWKDFIMVSIVLIQWISYVAWVTHFEDLGSIANAAIFIFMLFLAYYNPIVVTHNFLHTPFFKSNGLNRTFSLFNSMNMGLPQIIYKYHHLNHHRHNNSLEDPSSTFLFGKDGKQEHWIKYCALSFFRDGNLKSWKMAVDKGDSFNLCCELGMVLAFWTFLLTVSWKFFAFIYVPLYFCQWFLAHLENYFEHYMASDPDNKYGNSVSVYHPWYNVFMFNEGYHQEHHISPQVHWSKRPEVSRKFQEQMKAAKAYRAKMPPVLGMLE